MKIVRALLVVCLVALVGCAKSDEGAKPIASEASTSTPVPTPCSLSGGKDAPQDKESRDDIAAVTDVRYNAEGCPRIVFQFAGDHVPGYKIGYEQPPFSDCGSGAEVDTSSWNADAFIRVRLEPSGGVDLSQSADPTYKGPRDIAVDGAVLKHLKVTCDFEAVFTWIIGIDAKHHFKVDEQAEPARLVLDIGEKP